MYDEKTVQRFIELRVQGLAFARIAQELNVARNTLIDWSRKHQHTIGNQSCRGSCLRNRTTRKSASPRSRNGPVFQPVRDGGGEAAVGPAARPNLTMRKSALPRSRNGRVSTASW